MSAVDETNQIFATQTDLEGLLGSQAVTIMVLQKRLAAKDQKLMELEALVNTPVTAGSAPESSS